MSTSPQSGLWTMSKGEFEESVRVLEAAIAKRGGNPRQLFDRIRTDDGFTDRLAEFALRGGLEASTDQKLARAIMGQNFFGPEEWSALYGVRFTKAQLRRVNEFPWSEDVLNAPCPFHESKRVAETHFAFLGLDKVNGKPLTIMQWHTLHPRTGHPKFYFDPDPWYGSQTFATNRTCELRWYLMPVDIIPNSERKTFEEQLRDCLPTEYEVPTAIAEVSKDVLCHRKRGQYPNLTRWGRTEDKTSDGGRVYVGSCDEAVDVDGWWDGNRNDNIGLAASRKSPSA